MKRMKRWISLMLALMLALSLTACGGKEEPAPAEPEEPVVEQPDAANPEPPPAQETPQVPEGPRPLQLRKGSDWISEWDDNYNTLLTVYWDALALGEDSAREFPQLAESLAALNADLQEAGAIFAEEWLPYAREDLANHPEYFGGYTDTVTYTVRRADSRILSIRTDWDNFTGGMHPNYAAFGYNFDPATGEILTLEDVLADPEGVYPLLAEELTLRYPGMLFGEPEELLAEYTPEQLSWTMDYQGITFYFSPYELAPYAAGLLTVTLWFDETPELFRSEYTEAPAGGCVGALPEWYSVDVDLQSGDGLRDSLSVSSVNSQYGAKQLVVNVNGEEYREESWSAFHMTPYLVFVESGAYLYVEARGENDFRTMHIYDLSGGLPVPVSEFPGAGFIGHWDEQAGTSGVYYYDVFTNPGTFTLGSVCHLLGTKTAVRTYRVNGADGTLIPLEEDYGFAGEPAPIVSALPLDVVILPGEEVETLPAGTEFSFLRTDNEGWVTLELEDGRTCRIEIVEIDWTPTIGGVPEWECFKDLMYAG